MTNARTARSTREKAAALRAEAARREARRRSLVVSTVVAVVVVLVVAAVVLVANTRRDTDGGGAVPAAAANGTITVGQASAPVTVTAYEDFQCPVCRQFETDNAAQLQAWVAAGTVKIEYRPIAFLDRMSTTDYSTRALNAAALVADKAPAGFARFHAALFAEQPKEGSAGLTDARLIQLAVAAGVPQADAQEAIGNVSYRAWTKTVTDAASKAGVTGTPTVKVNGKVVSDWSAAGLKAAVDSAAG